ncbi:S1C family serine protease [Lactobacillus corticis]|uniref:Serine protease n=1 Tax=Lactobacillus corticis TaxID=2201249 RepID=A0A916QHR8_9LACO|nr:serine protease [Lactobacillus corticis]
MDNNDDFKQNPQNTDRMQNMQAARNPKPKKKKNRVFLKTAVIGLLAGLLGGGISVGAFVAWENGAFGNNTNATASVSSKSATTSKKSAETSSSMSSAYKQIKGAVVSVINLQRESSSSSDAWNSIFGDNDSSSSSSSKNSSLETYSEGSGVVYMKSNGRGYIVTNNHVVSGADSVRVIMANGKKVTAKIVGTDSTTDLAVLSIPARYVTQVAEFGDSSSLIAGQTVIAVGSPLGTEYASSVTQGIVSSPSRTLTTSSTTEKVIQTDAAINPGNSGGPLVNSAGQIVGINSMKLASSSDGTSVEGMGFAIPSNEVVKIINQLVKNGKVTRPQLGIKVIAIGDLPEAYKKQLGISTSIKSGIFVASVTSGSAAKKAGMKKGDVITALNGTKVSTVAKLHTLLNKHKVGDTVTLTINRSGKTISLKVTLQSN